MRITKREIIIGTSGFAVAALLIGGGLWWHGHSNDKQKSLGEQTVGDHTISLNQQSSEDSSGGLSVSSGSASDLGQLGGNQSQGSGGSGGSGGSSSGSSSSGGLDPSTFTQYEKYKSNKDALFGDITKGTGATLTSGKKATVYYKGWLTNGALFDQSAVSSSGQPQPFSFTLGKHEVIPGWEEGLAGMKAGGTRLVIVPPAVGYGSEGQGGVPPNAVMVFEVQMVSVK